MSLSSKEDSGGIFPPSGLPGSGPGKALPNRCLARKSQEPTPSHNEHDAN